MKKLSIRFEQDKTLESIDVVVRAREKTAEVENLMAQLSQRAPKPLTVLDRDGCSCVINTDEIVTVSADGKQVRVIAVQGYYRAKQSLQSVEQLLGDRRFLRISRFEVINLKKVRKYDFTLVGTLRVEFENGMETWASRRYIPQIKERLSGEEGYLC